MVNDDGTRFETGARYRGATLATALAMTGYCTHGSSPCTGNPTADVAPCLPTEHHYCGHGYNAKQATNDGQPRCPYCRGVTRRERNPDTYRPRREPKEPT